MHYRVFTPVSITKRSKKAANHSSILFFNDMTHEKRYSMNNAVLHLKKINEVNNSMAQSLSVHKWFTHTHTHTHTHLTALFPGLPGWAGTRKVKPIWILLKQETVSGGGISWAYASLHLAPDRITTPAPHHSLINDSANNNIQHDQSHGFGSPLYKESN